MGKPCNGMQLKRKMDNKNLNLYKDEKPDRAWISVKPTCSGSDVLIKPVRAGISVKTF
jgi:hypothetical protein